MDLIDRQVAIGNCKARLYESAMNNIGYECKADEVFRDIAEHRIGTWLEELPPVQPEPQWIPCSERLPEKTQLCLVTEKTVVGFETCTRCFNKRNDGGFWSGWGHTDVIAWMPLPEPYREERKTDEQTD